MLKVKLDRMLTDAIELSYILRKKREERGALDLDVDEAKIIVDKQGKPLDIVLRDRDDAEKLIEDFMVFANECVATHIYWQNLPFVYRIHDKPKTEKIMNFSRLIRPLGYLLKGENNGIHPKELQSLLNRIKDDNVKDVISSLMLRSLAKAKYDIKNVGHFGLASDCYTHFTSPIRRYPDLMVHRLLKLYSNYEASYDLDELYEKTMYQAEQSSIYERRAVSLERDVESMKMAEYMEDKIGYVYVGRITGMIQTGFFVSLDNLIEGMIRFDTMKDDYYNYDEKRMVIVGEGSKKVLKLGDKIKVKVKSASKQPGQIDFYFLRKM
jgi:ribonuclease R